MSLAIDAVILIIGIIIILVAAKKGLIRAVMGFASSIASLFLAYAYTPVLADYIRNEFLIDRITGNISETLKGWSFDTASDLYNLDRLITTPNADFSSVIERYGVGLDKIADRLRGLVGVTETEVHSVAEEIASPTSNVLASVIAFLAIFVVAFLVLSLITKILDAIFKLPVLSGINKLLGTLFGIVEAVFVAWVLSIALAALVGALGAISPDLFGADVVEKSIICRFFVEHNVFTWLTDLLQA